MSKRRAEESQEEALKSGERPVSAGNGDIPDSDFEDEYEDEYESEDEILEAGVDGRPDEEREAEEQEGMSYDPRFYTTHRRILMGCRRHGRRPRHIHTRS